MYINDTSNKLLGRIGIFLIILLHQMTSRLHSPVEIIPRMDANINEDEEKDVRKCVLCIRNVKSENFVWEKKYVFGF